MSRVIAIVEGPTEQRFITHVLAPSLAPQGVYITARIVGKPGHKGGVGSFARAKADIVTILREDHEAFVTTMFDYYGMPDNWPGRFAARECETTGEKAAVIETAIGQAVTAHFDDAFNPARIIPYVQMHEFEALLFANYTVLVTHLRIDIIPDLLAVCRDHPDPEAINDSPDTAPSKRILHARPGYRKALNGFLIASEIGVPALRNRCRHFHDWLCRLESLRTFV